MINLRSPLKTLVLLEFIKRNIEVGWKDIKIKDISEIVLFFEIPKPIALGDNFSFLRETTPGLNSQPYTKGLYSQPYTILINLLSNRRVFSKILNL